MRRVDSDATTAHTVEEASERARVAPEPKPWDEGTRESMSTAATATARQRLTEEEGGVFI